LEADSIFLTEDCSFEERGVEGRQKN